MRSILVIEDERGIAEPLVYQLGKAGFRARWVGDGREGLQSFQTDGADLVVLDLMLPGLPGDDVCRAIRKSSEVPIIMLTAKDDEVDRIVGLELGADDYVTKPFSTRELIARMKAILRRSRREEAQGSSTDQGVIQLDVDRREVTVRGRAVHLPLKEFDVLELLMRNANRVVTRERLIDEVWGPDYYGDMRTLDVHVKRIRAKIEVDPSEPEHLVTVRGVGYRFVP